MLNLLDEGSPFLVPVLGRGPRISWLRTDSVQNAAVSHGASGERLLGPLRRRRQSQNDVANVLELRLRASHAMVISGKRRGICPDQSES